MSAELGADLVKIRVDIENHERHTGETFWAKALGDDLYRLDNFPFYAFDLHYGDVVRAVHTEHTAFPTIVEVVQPSGHKTLRIVFDAKLSDEARQLILDTLTAAGAEYEHAFGRFYSVNMPPEADYLAVCDNLWRLEQEGHLLYETGSTT